MNFGFPLVSEDSEIYVRNKRMFTDTEIARKNATYAFNISKPENGTDEELYFYETQSVNGMGLAYIINKRLNILGYIKYSGETLPYLTEWKMMGEADYVIGLEAGNVIPRGRRYYREKGQLPVLAAQQQDVNEIEIGVGCGDEIEKFLSDERR